MSRRHNSPASVFAAPKPVTPIVMESPGPTFSPRVYLDTVTYPDARVLWTFSDGSRSDSLTPSFTGSGTHTLRCNRPHAIRTLNFGYDAGDAGENYTDPAVYNLAPVPITSISGLQQGAPHLERFLASHTGLVSVDFSGLSRLRIVEFFSGTEPRVQIATVQFEGCTALERVCFEEANLSALDIQDALAIEDVRGRGQRNGGVPFVITLGSVASMWHFCVGSQAGTIDGCDGLFDGTIDMPALQQLWTWGSGVGGVLAPRAGAMASLDANGSGHTAFDATHITWPQGGTCILRNNPLTALTLTGTIGLGYIDISDCSLSQALVDYALAFYAAGVITNGTLMLTGNSAPSAAGLASRDTLVGRGWTVTVAT